MGNCFIRITSPLTIGRDDEQRHFALLEGVRASLDRLMKSVAESRTPPGDAVERAEPMPEMKARVDEILARRFGFRANR